MCQLNALNAGKLIKNSIDRGKVIMLFYVHYFVLYNVKNYRGENNAKIKS